MYGIIYVVTNTVNGKQYVGQTTRSVKMRWYYHARSAKSSDCLLYCAIRKYGINKFTIEQIDVAESQDELNEKEIHHVARLGTYGGGYNLTPGGKQMRLSEETKRKISKSLSGRINGPLTDETRQKIAKALTGQCWSETSRQKRIKTWRNRPVSMHCKHGHLRTPDNTYTHQKTGHKSCWVCRYLAAKRRLPERLQCYLNP
jgi:group I intron endonuclease